MPSYEEKTKALVASLVNAGTINQEKIDRARKAQEEKAKEARKTSK